MKEDIVKFIICDMVLSCEEMRTAFYLSSTLTDEKLKFVISLDPPKKYVNSFCIYRNLNISTRVFLDILKWQYKHFDVEKYQSIMTNSLIDGQRKFSYEEKLEFFEWLYEKEIFVSSKKGYENLKTFFHKMKPNLDFVKSNLSRLHNLFNQYGLLNEKTASRDFERYFSKEDFIKLKEIYRQYSDLL